MGVNKTIFKEYDIRGLYPKEINAKIVYKIGRAFAKFLKLRAGDKVIIGQDKRPSSKTLSQAFISGRVDSNISVIDIGKVTTPMLYFAVPFFKARGGAMITASHLSHNSNGIKFTRKDAEPIGGKELASMSDIAEIDVRHRFGQGKIEKINIKKEYLKAVGWSANWRIKNKLPASFDYDGDRLMIKNFREDIIGGILADAIVKKGDLIIYDLRCTHALPEYFENKGIKTIPCRVGHYNIKKLMKEKRAVFGMEITGHYYFKEFHYCESPLYALRILNEQIEKTGKSLAELAKPFNKYFHPGVINFPVKNTERIIKIINKLKEKYKNGAQNQLDGLTIELSNWWFNVRPSNTEPLLKLVIEAKTPQLLEQKKKEVIDLIKAK